MASNGFESSEQALPATMAEVKLMVAAPRASAPWPDSAASLAAP